MPVARNTVVLLLATLGLGGCDDPQKACNVAYGWLQTIDGHRYGQSWDDASDWFRSMIDQDEWVEMVSGAVDYRGNTSNRELEEWWEKSTHYGAPDGKYLVCRFKTSFENSDAPISEEVLLLKNEEWQIMNYVVGKPRGT